MERGDSGGSNIHDDHLEFLCQTRQLPRAANVEVWVPLEREISLALRDGERIVFRSHFLCGFGLPASDFLCSFLNFYHLQPHHLTPNMVVLLSAIITLCEGYLGVFPTIELWGELFYLKLGTAVKGQAAQCRACMVV